MKILTQNYELEMIFNKGKSFSGRDIGENIILGMEQV